MGPRPNPGGGSSQSTPKASQANWADASSGMLALADACSCEGACASAEAVAARTAMLAPTAAIEAQRVSALDTNFAIGIFRAPAQTRKACAVISIRSRRPWSEIRGARHRDAVVEQHAIALGADLLAERLFRAPIAFHASPRLVVRVGVRHRENDFHELA